MNTITVKTATEQAFKEMPPEFHVVKLIIRVRSKLQRPYVTDGCITRRLRELRSDKLCDYSVIDNHRAIYQKNIKEKQLELFN
ncbi:MAG: hypothetical protein KAT68_17870 [Bacteroidales bacterium]|nr:hypothetical protein [Bacteroidales bacterium]